MERIVAVILIGAVIYGMMTVKHTPAPTLRGEVPIERIDTDFHLWNDGRKAEDRIQARDRASGKLLGDWDVDERGVLNQHPAQAKDGLIILETVHEYYCARKWFDIGGWVGVVNTKSGDPPVQLGIRLSPVRFFDGILAADAVSTEHAIGVGLSLYPPRGWSAEPPWNRLGVGLWYVAAYNGGGSGLALGLSTTIR
jgi:hypothetical protein